MHKIIAANFDRILRKEIDRLIIACPPQHGKSTIASKRFPALAMGREPTLDIISASATAPLAHSFGRDVRNCVASSEYQSLFPETTLAEDSQAKGLWNTNRGGLYYAVGAGGAIMGRGAELGLIDDPFATWEDAQSALQRDALWDWYLGSFYNRVRPGGAIVVIEHRMHEEDLIGRLLERMKQGKDQWTVVEIPADLADPPWEQRYDRAALERLKENTDPRKWAALYMQNPVPEDGTFFKREWAKWYSPKSPPGTMHRYASSDFAVTEGGGDYTEIWTHGVDPGSDLYLGLDAFSGQTTADVWIEQMVGQFKKHQPFAHFGESGVIRRAIEPVLIRRMHETGTFTRLEWITRTRDKASTARALQARMAMGKVYLPDNEHGHRLLAQMLAFPAGIHDDAVDQAALMALALDQAHPATTATVTPLHKPDRWERVFEDDNEDEDSWKTA